MTRSGGCRFHGKCSWVPIQPDLLEPPGGVRSWEWGVGSEGSPVYMGCSSFAVQSAQHGSGSREQLRAGGSALGKVALHLLLPWGT